MAGLTLPTAEEIADAMCRADGLAPEREVTVPDPSNNDALVYRTITVQRRELYMREARRWRAVMKLTGLPWVLG